MPVDYGLQAGGPKPLYGSSFVVNENVQPNVGVRPQQFSPTEKTINFRPQNTPNEQISNPINNYQFPTKPDLNTNTNYRESTKQQFPIRQNSNQNPSWSYPQGYVNPELGTVPSGQPNFESSQPFEQDNYEIPNSYGNAQETQDSQFVPNQNNYKTPTSYGTSSNNGNLQGPQNPYLNVQQEQNNQQKNKIRFPFPNENAQVGYPHRTPTSNPSNIDPNLWMKGQLKGKQMAGQSTYTNGYNHRQTEYEEFQAPNNHLNKPASTFNLGNREQIENDKQTYALNSYDSSGVISQSHPDYGQQSSMPNGQDYNFNPPPSYSPLSKFNQPKQPQSSNALSQDRRNSGDSKTNKQFKIVVPDISEPNDNIEQSPPTSYSQNRNPSQESISNRGSSGKKLNNYNGSQYPNNNENVGTVKKPSSTDNRQSASQNSPVYTSSAGSSKCPNNFNGIKPHPTDCSKFLSCANGRTFEMDCGPGTLFNPTISVCDYPYNVECSRNDVTTPKDHFTIPSTANEYYTTPTEYYNSDQYYTTPKESYNPNQYYTTPKDSYNPVQYYTTPKEDYNPPIDMRRQFDPDTSSSDQIAETEPLENQNQAVLETLPTENRQFKILKNPSSIDLPDNFLSNSSITHTPPKVINNRLDNVAVRVDLKPNSTQSIRLRGGPKNSEGFLQVQDKPFQWGVVCDSPNAWTIDKADIVCKQLGFKR